MIPLVLHPQTAQQLTNFAEHPSHALLLYGPPGSGKETVAASFAADMLGLDVSKLDSYPYLLKLDGPSISSAAVEGIRQLEHFLSLRVPTARELSRIVIITNAQALSLQAQNALLKTIEEPPVGTLLILTALSQASVLPTINSRAQAINIKRPAKAVVVDHFITQNHDKAAVDQAFAMSGGLPGLMMALLTDTAHPLQPATETARQLLQKTVYERLLMVEDLAKQKPLAINTLFILQQMAHARLQTTEGDQFQRWKQVLTACYEASEQLANSGQPKLVLDALMLKLT